MKFHFPILLSASGLLHSCAIAQTNKDSILMSNRIIARLSVNRTKADSLIVDRYLNDTTGFTTFPNKSLLDSLVLSKEIAYWELNEVRNQHVWGLMEEEPSDDMKGLIKGGCEGCKNTYIDWLKSFRYNNVYRSSNKRKSLPDSIMLTKTRMGIRSALRPFREPYKWYLSIKKKDGKLLTVDTDKELDDFIGKLQNPYNALFWMTCIENQQLFGGPDFKYKAVLNGHLMVVHWTEDFCPLTDVDALFYVDKNQKSIFIKILKLTSGGCV